MGAARGTAKLNPMKRRSFLVIGLLAALVAAFLGYRAWNETVPEAADHKPEMALPAGELFLAFQQDEAAAGRSYNGKLIQVQGAVREARTEEDGRLIVLLETGDAMGAVLCEFPIGAKVPGAGTSVTIKGYCAGYNFDVLLQRCAFVPEHR